MTVRPSNLSSESVVKIRGTNTTKYGINTLNFRGKMQKIIPKNLQLPNTLSEFNNRLKKQLLSCNRATSSF